MSLISVMIHTICKKLNVNVSLKKVINTLLSYYYAYEIIVDTSTKILIITMSKCYIFFIIKTTNKEGVFYMCS